MKYPPCFFLALLSLALSISPAMGQWQRVANGTVRMPQELPLVGFGVSNAFGGLEFEQPVAVLAPPGETNRLFVVERTGHVMVITNLTRPDKTLFLDLTENLHFAYLEAGLLGMAFHPGYATNRLFFIYRTLFTSTRGTGATLHDQLSRFETSLENPNLGLAASEQRLIAQEDLHDTHNAGDLQFGPDGYLYVSLGDEAPPPADVSQFKQPIDKAFFGGILRIDVDKRPGSLAPNPRPGVTDNYGVPPNNPFVGATSHQGIPVDPSQVRTEFYAIGFRNPWRMSFDPVTGALFVGDVGQDTVEEINLVVKGGNYGWPYLEGLVETDSVLFPRPPVFSSLPPLVDYFHGNGTNEGASVVGGIVYLGNKIPQLRGAYVFGDTVRGNIWSLRYDGTTNRPPFTRLTADPGISAFGRDPRDGEVLVVNFKQGIIKRLVFVPPEQAAAFPRTWEETGVFSDLLSLRPNAGVEPYELNVPFWSDHAIKSRWFSVPDLTQTIQFQPEGNWTFPTGSVWIKHFDLELVKGVPASRRRLETRLLVRNAAGVYGVTYRWGEDQTNAVLVGEGGLDDRFTINEGGILRTQVWHYPTRAECQSCHSSVGGLVLGFNTPQLNLVREAHGTVENQILALSRAGYFDLEVTDVSGLRALARPTETEVPLQDRVRSYLAANCSQCHQPEGPTLRFTWDGRITTPMDKTELLDGFHITPNSLFSSSLFRRVSLDTFGDILSARMPPIGSTVLDPSAKDLLAEWINSFPLPPWQSEDVGQAGRDGSSSVSAGVLAVSGSGAGLDGARDEFQYLYRPFDDSSQWIVRLVSQQQPDPEASAGLMIRDSLDQDAPYAMVFVTADGRAAFRRRTAWGAASVVDLGPRVSVPAWLRLLKEGDGVSGYFSSDGRNWDRIGGVTLSLWPEGLAGLAVSAHNQSAVNLARFDGFRLLSVHMTSPSSGSSFTLPADLSLIAQVDVEGLPPSKVEFYSDSEKIGESSTAPFSMVWSNALAGPHSLTVRALDASGVGVVSDPIHVTMSRPRSLAVFGQADAVTRGNWKGAFGGEGRVLSMDATNLPAFAVLTIVAQEEQLWESAVAQLAALERTTGPGRVAAAWSSGEALTLDLDLRDGELHRVSLYFLDGGLANARSQRVELRDPDHQLLLEQREVSTFSGGLYLTWTVRGHVQIVITPTGQGSAVLSGLFLDADLHVPPAVSLTNPPEGSSVVVPAAIVLTAAVANSGLAPVKVEFLANGLKLGEATTAPYTLTWSDALEGDYWLVAVATDQLGSARQSDPVRISLAAPPPQVFFRGMDVMTQGNWLGTYGGEGFVVVNYATNLPPWMGVGPRRNGAFTFDLSSTNAYALQGLTDDTHMEAVWFSTSSFLVDMELMDGNYHLVSIYVADFNDQGREQSVELIDPLDGRVLDVRTMTSFSGGKYYSWSVRGHVRFRLTQLRGSNAVLSGLFVDEDRNQSPVVRITRPRSGESALNSAPLLITMEAGDPEGRLQQVELFSGETLLASFTQGPFDWSWVHPPVGNQTLTAVATDFEGRRVVSAPVYLNIRPSLARGDFLRADTTAHGNWIGTYGAEGWEVINYLKRYPSFAQVSETGTNAITWDAKSGAVRALRRTDSAQRIAAAWSAAEAFTIDLNLTDQRAHRLALYFLDWDSKLRAQQITLSDAETGAALDSRSISNFFAGEYLVWRVLGHVRIRVAALGPRTAVVSGLFLDPEPNQPTVPVLLDPPTGATYALPASIPLAVQVTPTNRTDRVEFLDGDKVIGQSAGPPYSLIWSNAFEGPHFVSARVTDGAGRSSLSGASWITAVAPGASASLEGRNTFTQGDWRGVYGGDGFGMLGEAEQYPAYAKVDLDGYYPFEDPNSYFPFIWSDDSSDPAALQHSSGLGRVLAAWVATPHFTIDLNLKDGRFHRVTMYCLDWGSALKRAQSISIVTAADHRLLASADVTDFGGGQYLEWNIRGHVKINVVSLNQGYAVVSGLFFDSRSNASPTIRLTSPADGAVFLMPATVPLQAQTADPDGTVKQVEFFDGPNRLIQVSNAPFAFTWTNAPEGPHVLTARATDNLGGTQDSRPITVTVRHPPPLVSLASPSSGLVLTAPTTLFLEAKATAQQSVVAKVEFYWGDNHRIGEVTGSPFQFNWENVMAGVYALTAVMTDSRGGTATSAPVRVVVNQPPVVSLLSPSPLERPPTHAEVLLRAAASDVDGTIRKVEFFSGTTLLAVRSTAPFEWVWTDVPTGIHSLSARATDDLGATTISEPVPLTVNTPPQARLVTPTDQMVFRAPADILFHMEGFDPDGTIRRLALFWDDVLLDETINASHDVAWSGVPAGTYAITLEATDDMGASAVSPVAVIHVIAPPVVTLRAPADATSWILPTNVVLEAEAEAGDEDGLVREVEFFAGDRSLGVVGQSPYSLVWSNPLPADYVLSARATDDRGMVTTSRTVRVSILLPSASAVWVRTDTNTLGDWVGEYGFEGYHLMTHVAQDPPYARVISSGREDLSWEDPSEDPRGLLNDNGPGRLAAAWVTETNLVLDLTLVDGRAHQVALYGVDWEGQNARAQRVEIYDAESRALLDSQSFSNFSGGQYWVWNLRGHVELHLVPAGLQTAVISGLFFDPRTNVWPSIRLTSPAAGGVFVVGAPLPLRAEAVDADGVIEKVEFFDGPNWLGQVTSRPFSFAWSDAPEGPHVLIARATDNEGGTRDTDPVIVTVRPPDPVVSLASPPSGLVLTAPATLFLEAEASAQGAVVSKVEFHWGEHHRIGEASQSPFQLTWDKVAAGEYWLTAVVTDSRGGTATSGPVLVRVNAPPEARLITPTNETVLRAPAEILFHLEGFDPDGSIQRLALFWDDVLLGEAADASFDLAWTGVPSGTYAFSAQARDDSGASTVSPVVLIRVDGPPTVMLQAPADSTAWMLPTNVVLVAEAGDEDGHVREVEFFAGARSLGVVGQPPYSLVWSNPLPADYVLWARATDDGGMVTTSLTARVSIRLPPARAVWLHTDTNTLGDWIGTYGFEGYHLMTHVAQAPAYAEVISSGHEDLGWEIPSEDPRALLDDNGTGRLAAAWGTETNLAFDLTLVDGQAHQLALYCLDWEGRNGREQRVEIYDAENRVLLDSQSLSNFSGGQYWVWSLRGHVELNLVPTGSKTAVVSGWFFDRVSPLATWKAVWFKPEQRGDPAISGDSADPDLDGIRNIWEYALGFSPIEATRTGLPAARIADDHFYFTYTRNLEATDVWVGLEVSTDLVTWQPAEGSLEEAEASQTTTTRTVTLRSRGPVSAMPQAFVRLRVEKR